MPTQQALAPHDPSAIHLQPVPDVWPPVDSPPGTAARLTWPAGSAEPGGPRDAEAHSGIVPREQAEPRQFAVLLAEALAGVRPVRQVSPWLSERGAFHLHRLLPLFADGHQPRVQRVLTTRPATDVIEMTLIVSAGTRTRALAVRLERARPTRRPGWLCTDIEAA